MTDRPNNEAATADPPGDCLLAAFPYPWAARDDESQQLVDWIRNHSSYLTVGHLAAKLGRVAAFIGGTIGNWLFMLPWMLAAALIIGYLHFYFLDHWFRSWIVLSLLGWWPVGKAFRQKEKRSGTQAWNPTWTPTRRGGALLLASAIAAAIVFLPHLVELLRDLERDLGTGPAQAGTILAAVMAALRFAQGFVAKRSGLLLIVLQVATAMLGILFLAGIVTWLENYVVYGNPYFAVKNTGFGWLSLFNPLVVFSLVAFLLVAIIAWARLRRYRVFQNSWPWFTWTVRYQLVSFVAGILIWAGLSYLILGHVSITQTSIDQEMTAARRQIGNQTLPISRMVDALDRAGAIPTEQETDDWNAGQRRQFAAEFGLSDESLPILRSLAVQRIEMGKSYNAQPPGQMTADESVQNRSEWAIDYFGEAQKLVDTAAELAEQSPTEMGHLRSIVSEVYRRKLIDEIPNKNPKKPQKSDLRLAAIREACYQSAMGRLIELRGNKVKPTDWLPLITSPKHVNDVVAEARNRKVNAYHQKEYAELVGAELKVAGDDRIGRTIASRGEVGLAGELPLSELETIVREESLAALADVLNTGDGSLSDIADKEMREQLRLRLELRQKSLSQLANFVRSDKNSPASQLAFMLLLRRAIDEQDPATRSSVLSIIAEQSRPSPNEEQNSSLERYQTTAIDCWPKELFARALMARFGQAENDAGAIAAADDVVVAIGQGGNPLSEMKDGRKRLMWSVFWPKLHLFMVAGLIAIGFGFFADANANSMHGYYRDHLVNTFFVSRHESDQTEMEETQGTGQDDLPAVRQPTVHSKFQLTDLCPMGSSAPYLLVNGALNLQGVEDASLRNRLSDFFFFSKFFYGSERTGYARSELLQASHPKMTLGTAMAISGAAVSPNSGRRTNGFLVMVMTLLNIRLGYWIPQPRVFHKSDATGPRANWTATIEEVIKLEHKHAVLPRRLAAYESEENASQSDLSDLQSDLVGLALSGGGIRSASFVMGIIQVLEHVGIFRHIDYLSTVSGGGYAGCGLSVSLAKAFERSRQDATESEVERLHQSQGESIAKIDVSTVRPRRLSAFYYGRELISNVHDRGGWVNVSDGGHIENLGVFELLRRRCRLVIACDGEADPNYTFNGLATLIRLAELELQAKVTIDVTSIRPRKPVSVQGESKPDPDALNSKSHFAVGTITYSDGTEGKLVYLKSSLTGDEDVPIDEYCRKSPDFPHQTTADQLFDQDQFDSYRALGAHVASEMTKSISGNRTIEQDMFRIRSDFHSSFTNSPSVASRGR